MHTELLMGHGSSQLPPPLYRARIRGRLIPLGAMLLEAMAAPPTCSPIGSQNKQLRLGVGVLDFARQEEGGGHTLGGGGCSSPGKSWRAQSSPQRKRSGVEWRRRSPVKWSGEGDLSDVRLRIIAGFESHVLWF